MAAKDQAMQDCWNSSTSTASRSSIFPVGQTPPYQSGIAAAWRALFNLSPAKQIGPPLTQEYDSVDWNGGRIVVQEFPGGRCEWYNNSAHWQFR